MNNKLQKCYVCARKLKEPKYFSVFIRPEFSDEKIQKEYSEFYKICGEYCMKKLFKEKYKQLENKLLEENQEK